MASQRLKMENKGGVAAQGPTSGGPTYTKVPEKYRNPKTSPEQLVVEAGRQVHNIEIKD
jgi:hypothetical protein